VLSAIRIHAIATLDYLDFSYSVVPDGVYSVLEPCLGVINASLPVLQPIAEKISHSRIFSLIRGSYLASSYNRRAKQNSCDWEGPPSKDLAPGPFRRLDDRRDMDDYIPLTETHKPSSRSIQIKTDLQVDSLPRQIGS